jgi:hypothetical protein
MATEKFTTAGALQIKKDLPTQAAKDAYDIYEPLTKGGVATWEEILQ